MVWPASVAVVTAVSWVVEVKVGVAGSGMALAMGLGVCSPPQGYSDRESLYMNGETDRQTDRQTCLILVNTVTVCGQLMFWCHSSPFRILQTRIMCYWSSSVEMKSTYGV